MGERMIDNLNALSEKHAVIGQVRGKGLFCGAELVADRATKDPAEEKLVQAVVADCAAQGVLIGATNPLESAPGTIRGDLAVEVGRNVIRIPHRSTRCDSVVWLQLLHSTLIDVQGERTTFESVGARLRVTN